MSQYASRMPLQSRSARWNDRTGCTLSDPGESRSNDPNAAQETHILPPASGGAVEDLIRTDEDESTDACLKGGSNEIGGYAEALFCRWRTVQINVGTYPRAKKSSTFPSTQPNETSRWCLLIWRSD